MRFLHAVSAFALVTAAPAIAQDKGKSVDELHKQAMAEAAKDAWTVAPVEERTVSGRHSVNADGRTLKYTTTAVTLTIRALSPSFMETRLTVGGRIRVSRTYVAIESQFVHVNSPRRLSTSQAHPACIIVTR